MGQKIKWHKDILCAAHCTSEAHLKLYFHAFSIDSNLHSKGLSGIQSKELMA